MEIESPTLGAETQDGLDNQPTVQTQSPTADATNQETISPAQATEAVSDDSTAPTNVSGADETDEGLAKFAKGQGISDEDFTALSEREKKLLKLAKDNQTAARNKPADKPLSEAVKETQGTPTNETDNDATLREIRQFRYERETENFFEGKDRSLEPTMAEILNKKLVQLTPSLGEEEAKKYVFNLSRDLDTLYNMAQIETGKFDPNAAKQEGRQEERDSIRRQAGAAAPEAHATSSAPASSKIDLAWVQNTYDSNNPEHRKILDEAMARGDLY